MREVHKENELLFFLNHYFTYNLTKFVSFKVLHFTLDTPLPAFFSNSRMRPGTCFAGWRKGHVSNFLLSPLPSESLCVCVRRIF
jgi:hypothetical protein